MTSDTVTLPAHWASYLINGDASGLDDHEEAQVDNHMTGVKGRVVDMIEGSERFTWSYDIYGGSARGGDVADFVVLN